MKYCLKCKHLSPAGSEFCLGCGGAFVRRCPNGHETEPSATHCPTCSAPILALYAPSVPVVDYARVIALLGLGLVAALHLRWAMQTGYVALQALGRFLLATLPLLLFAVIAYLLMGDLRRFLVPMLRALAKVVNGATNLKLQALHALARHAGRESEGSGNRA